ncbi:required for excision 1-B domain-containing protein-like isoform X2 [Homarus americanus]|uniref:required for excision 1-B domain-containing protein-like isoform X2 n=1 Tax=Homarus americanus TaxID=6706 RepID=UPI001C45C3DB|nr:required for excision 1-B domain-containing protein-like isoform X2 [Homarus americanus]
MRDGGARSTDTSITMQPVYTMYQSVMLENNSLSMIHQFDQLQEERVHSYRLLEEGHKIYLSTGPNYDFPMFRKLVHDVTQDFKRISEGIIVVEKALRTDGYTSAADIITSLQESEKKKLELTARLQLSCEMLAESDNGELETNKVKEIRNELGKVVEQINNLLTELRYEIHNGE